MQNLRSPECAIGADNSATREINAVAAAIATRQLAADTDRMKAKVCRLCAVGRLHVLTLGERRFCGIQGINYM